MRKHGQREHQLLDVTLILCRVIMIFIQYERLSITCFCVRCAATVDRQEWRRSKALFCALPILKCASTA